MLAMNHRSGEIYVSRKVVRGLNLAVLKTSDEEAKVSSDKLADDALNEWLRSHHREIMDYVDKREDEEAEFRKSLARKAVAEEEGEIVP